ncbi:MAG: hypothetical protein ACLTMH_09710 [Faecalimonas umbilicata]|uniref:hypothetical protein n=1 Tax=Faecalimonas umbilicata TaxID=1912855 RepID=UPI00399379D1
MIQVETFIWKGAAGIEQAPQFEDGKIQTVKSGTEQWYVYDVQYEMENGAYPG